MPQVHIKSSGSASWNFNVPSSAPRHAAKEALAQLRQHLGGTREVLRSHTLLVRVGQRHYRLAARAVPRSLRAGGGDTQHFFFISDIEGCYDFYEECVKSIVNYKEGKPKLCILGDIPDRNDILTQIKVYEHPEYGLCHNDGAVGSVLKEEFNEVVRILGNRDGNKARFKNEPCKLTNYPDFGGGAYSSVDDMFAKTLGMSVKEFVDDDPDNVMCKKFKDKFTDLKSCYLRYIKHAHPCAKLADGLFCAHGCPPTKDEECEEYNKIYQHFLAKWTAETDPMDPRSSIEIDKYDKKTAEVKYNEVPERFFADISANHSVQAWENAKVAWKESGEGDTATINGSPVVRSYKSKDCKMQLSSMTDLKGVVGHQPVGYFPHLRNGLLCIDVSAANEQGFRGTKRESMPMIHLEFTDNKNWNIHVKVKIPTDGNRFHKGAPPPRWKEEMKLSDVTGPSSDKDVVVEYDISPSILKAKNPQDPKDVSYKNGIGTFVVGQMKNKKYIMITTFVEEERMYQYKYSIES